MPSAQNMSSASVPAKLSLTIYTETIQFLLQNNALQMAEQALSKLLLCSDDGRSVSYLFFLAQWQLLRTEYENAADTLKEILSHGSQDADVWALNGHCQYLLKAFSKSVKSYEQSLDLFPLPSDIHFVLLRLGSIYFQEKQYERAKDVYLRACRHTPSCLTWLGLGMACYKLEKLDEAESALNEATNFNFQNAEMWGYLCQISLRCGREEEAKQAYHFATKVSQIGGVIRKDELCSSTNLSSLFTKFISTSFFLK
ncbi:cilia- and flagella-associated protein 70-like isoform X1 [Thalassophryne amazonica]|uniref:cilia- and flagella-associated protein 70-like isoform X1 n=1 Tax=Thalassophryne amazonica TaxID=390379 RepID=UPI001470FC34|nr:cilia- and flagella-associated protein 70-like isoform X1 [Thalassophryne amazonica]